MKLKSQPFSHPGSLKKLSRRHAAEKRFHFYGRCAAFLTLSFLLILLMGISFRGFPAFFKNQIGLDITFNPLTLSKEGICSSSVLSQEGLSKLLPHYSLVQLQELNDLISPGICEILLKKIRAHPPTINQTHFIWLPVSDNVNLFLGTSEALQKNCRLSALHIQALKAIQEKGQLKSTFNWQFFTHGDARNPEFAGIAYAFIGSFYLMVIALLLAFPLGVASALYLEEFSKPGRWTTFIEVSISNLAAVPSIVFGLLGLALLIGFLKLPRSSALVGGLTLGFMMLPSIIITTRTALRAIPKTIRAAAQALGASEIQVAFHHVFPLAIPGILTGTLIGMARALGETAPLLMIGMMAFIYDKPHSPLDPTSALPLQIFSWARNPEPGFMAHAAAGILVLLAFLFLMNIGALFLRRKFAYRW